MWLVPKILSKLLKVLIALLRRLNIRPAIYLDNILLIGRRLEEILMNRNSLSGSLSGFCHISEKTVLKPSHQIEIFVLKKDTHTMNLTLTEEKMEKVIFKCQIFFSLPQITVLL